MNFVLPNDMFRHLHVCPELACRFLATFSRMEYALKASGYLQNVNDAHPDWDRFAADIRVEFEEIDDGDFRTAVKYLREEPPCKQIVQDGQLTFVDRPADGQPVAHQVLLMVRRVRNNLFHGGKYSPASEANPGRDRALIEYSLIVLEHCITQNSAVRERYEQ